LPESIRNAEVVIAPNREMLMHAAKYARLPDYFIIPNYPPKNFYKEITLEQARYNLDLKQDSPIALFVGGARLRSIYGIDLLIDTWRKVRRKDHDSLLYILGPYEQLGFSNEMIELLSQKGIVFPGIVEHTKIPEWIAAADICLSQRTPGFPKRFYNTKDSLKLSEYAIFKKSIVTAGYGSDSEYLSAETNPESYANAIMKGFAGEAPKPTPHFWEENLSKIKKAYSLLMNQ
jgi:glycosyltransferase involved in cell wall biosynthesis